ncbi:hypothetical protein [Leifsonia xyli]|uniref:hypothetical protein n=1 Tax=Leifsonia xyli TaxID=1575 RepID=UPI0002FCCDE3|nr:hypothetical protein [Leifsonia xyli]
MVADCSRRRQLIGSGSCAGSSSTRSRGRGEWSAAMLDEWMLDLVSVHRLAASTMRHYQLAIG